MVRGVPRYNLLIRILHANELKYLGVHVSAAKSYLTFSVEHIILMFYRMFNCIFSKSKAANFEMVTVALGLRPYCLPFVLYAVEAISVSSVNMRMPAR